MSVVKNVLIAGIIYILLLRGSGHSRGRVTGSFLILYAVLRFSTEYLRIQDIDGAFGLTRGQLYTVPLLILGFWLYRRSGSHSL